MKLARSGINALESIHLRFQFNNDCEKSITSASPSLPSNVKLLDKSSDNAPITVKIALDYA